MTKLSGNTGIAFAVTCGAGLSTGIGAAIVFFPSLVKLASRKVLASGLAFSAGVMTYVSFLEILPNGLKNFEEVPGLDGGKAYSYGTVGFFVGVIALFLIDGFIHICLGHNHHHDHEQSCKVDEDDVSVPPHVCVHDVSASEIDGWQRNAQQEIDQNLNQTSTSPGDEDFSENDGKDDIDTDGIEAPPAACGTRCNIMEEKKQFHEKHDKQKLNHMGLTTALAIALHNFPEGLATFVATLADPRVGLLLGIAIAIHNVPEGLCVALPIYYSTGSRLKGFLWGFGSGLAEPFAALLGWLVLAPYMTSTVYAILDVLIAGLMVAISTKELLPTAHRYDPKDSVATYSYIAGMMVMGLSLIFFNLTA